MYNRFWAIGLLPLKNSWNCVYEETNSTSDTCRIEGSFVEIWCDKAWIVRLDGAWDNKPDSDIDVLIDFQPEQETFQNFMAVCDLLESFFKRQKLDIVTFKGLSPFVGQQILKEVECV